MGFPTPMHELGEYLKWTRSGDIQLPDFQRGYKWEDERTSYLPVIETRAQIDSTHLDGLVATHLIPTEFLRQDHFEEFFRSRRESLCELVENAIGKAVQRDIDLGFAEEDSAQFEPDEFPDEAGMEND